jgi:4-hydroxy-2-oxoheptanedioate aldolase
LARVWTRDSGLIGKVLDLGLNGVLVPRVRRREEAESVVEAARYAPAGARGFAPLISYSASRQPQNVMGESVLVVIQVEGAEGVQHSREIATVPGVDAIFVGPYDLAQSLGHPGEISSEEVLRSADEVARNAVGEAMLGIYVHDPDHSRTWAERGFRFQCVSFDSHMLRAGADAFVARARGHLNTGDAPDASLVSRLTDAP